MDHIRLGGMPTSRRWSQVVVLLRLGGTVPELAAATAHSAERRSFSDITGDLGQKGMDAASIERDIRGLGNRRC